LSFRQNINKIIEKHDLLNKELIDASQLSQKDFIQKSKEYSNLTPIVEKIQELNKIYDGQKELELLIEDDSCDTEMKNLAKEELYALKDKVPILEKSLKLSFLPKDEADEKNAIIEIRAGTGGEEAALFAAVLFRMYQRYAENSGWKFEILEVSTTDKGGIKEGSALISGKSVFSKLKFESGVHRVQRVPETESSGRVHTSAATVAVLPEAEDVDVKIEDKDLRIDVFRASGAGGQHVNTTESAVRIVHLPTGITVQQQDEKSQHKNKATALKILRSRIFDMQRSAQEAKRAADRKGQIGTGDRSERIRTYNYSQSRVTDHRINLTLYKIDEIVNEGYLDEMIDALIADDEAKRLADVS
jgi:peptide chain release factor 1